MSTEPVGTERLGAGVRLKNLVEQAEKRLVQSGLRSPEARDLLEPLQALVNDPALTEHSGRGVAIFADRQSLRWIPVDEPLDEFVHVGKRFYVKALLPLASRSDRFFVLALSQNRTRLFEAGREGITEVEVADLPARMDEALRLDTTDRGEQVHSGGPFGSRKEAAVFHGQGGTRDRHKDDLKSYFREVNRSLATRLKEEQIPLILVGVEYLMPIFREVCDYSGLVSEQVEGNSDYLEPHEIYQQVWSVMEPLFDAPRKSAAARFRHSIGKGKASDDTRDVLLAAVEGRVEALFVNPQRHQWGVFDEASKQIDVHARFEPGDDDLLELAAVETLRRGGDVYSTEAVDLIRDEPVAALFRY
jgi:hypothetical protein